MQQRREEQALEDLATKLATSRRINNSDVLPQFAPAVIAEAELLARGAYRFQLKRAKRLRRRMPGPD
jgi:hypothetical protein